MFGCENIEDFKKNREELNQIVLKYAGKEIKRFFNLDTNVYKDGAISAKTKEMLALVASTVLRCDDCIKYHIIRCYDEGLTDKELQEALAIALIVGGSITIPHIRRAFKSWEELKEMKKQTLFTNLLDEIEQYLYLDKPLNDRLEFICKILAEKVDYYNWVGFYLVNPQREEELILGPYVGEPTEHIKIPFGKGICGQAADRQETFVIQDVNEQDNYLSCSINVKSEIVVPIIKNNVVFGELDIDSHLLSPFDEQDKEFLENICGKLAEYF